MTSRPEMTSRTAPIGTGRPTHRWGVLFVLAGNMLVDALEVAAMIVVMPSVGKDLDLGPGSLQGLMTGFALGFGGMLFLAGNLVARLGRRRVYLFALLVFALASLLAALSGDPLLLIGTRLVKGACVALTAPTGLAIIGTVFPAGRDRDRAVSVYAFFGACGFLAGLLSTGLLAGTGGWRWALAFPAPIVLVLMGFGYRLIPGDSAPASPGTTPIGLDLLRNASWARAAVGAAVLNGSYLGLLFVLTFQLQTGLGWGPLHTAVALLPAGAPLALSALASGRMVGRFGAPRLIAAGALILPFAALAYRRPGTSGAYFADVLPTLLVLASAFVLSFAALNIQATSTVPQSRRAAAGSLYQVAVQGGALVVLTVTGVLLTPVTGRIGGAGPVVSDAGAHTAVLLIAVVGAAAVPVALTGLGARRPPTART